MERYLYEKSVAHRGFLIIPFLAGNLSGRSLYSYVLLAGYGYQHQWHKAENPAGCFTEDPYEVVQAAKAHLDKADAVGGPEQYFRHRYTYLNNLVVLYKAAGKYYYDHYAPYGLNNIAAPKLFPTEQECIEWIRLGLLRRAVREVRA
ncbi:MAG: hypothetical protein AB4040_13360 [Synechococcus sp.]